MLANMRPIPPTRSAEARNLGATGARTRSVPGWVLPRRAVLRGAGAALFLPWLEAMARAGARAPEPPRRLVYVYVPNGVQRPAWRPEAVGELAQLGTWPATLLPLRHLAGKFSVLGGLDQAKANPNGDGPGDHARAAAAFLTGVQPLKADGAVRLGVSADLLAAEALAGATRLANLALGCEGARQSGQCDSGYACAYQGHLSWRSATVPEHKETSPSRLFDRLFRGGDSAQSPRERSRRRAVLDAVLGDLKRLEGRLGAADRHKLDEYTTGVVELERRLAVWREVEQHVPDSERPDETPTDLGEHGRLFFELIARAFEIDAVRVVSVLLTNEGSNRAYRELDQQEGHHGLSHHQGDPAKCAALARIDRFHVELLAGFLDRLDGAIEAGHTLLDQSMVVYGSGIGDGDKHDHEDLPLLLAGKGGGTLHPGRHVRYPRGTPMNDLHLALLERLGVRPNQFGDGRGPLDHL